MCISSNGIICIARNDPAHQRSILYNTYHGTKGSHVSQEMKAIAGILGEGKVACSHVST